RRVPLGEAALDRPCERLPKRPEHVMPTTRRQGRAPVLEFDLPQRVRVTVAERVAGLPELRGQLPLRRGIDGTAVPLEERVEEVVDGPWPIERGKEVAAP